jgi:glutathione S-transferase
MIELYHAWDSFCSFKVRLCLEEKGLIWTGHVLDLMKFENLRPDYLKVNPAGLVPALVDGGTVITESSIINEYLDDAYPQVRLRPKDAKATVRMRHWVRHEEDELFIAVRPASLNLMMKQVLGRYSEAELDALLRHHPRQDRVAFLKKTFHEPYDPDAVAKSRRRLATALKRMNATLTDAPWLAGEDYSLADIAAAPVVDRIEYLGMADLWHDLPGVKGWVARLQARPAYARALPLDERRLPAPQVAAAR